MDRRPSAAYTGSMMIAKSRYRVASFTSPRINERLRRQAERNVEIASLKGPDAIRARIDELDREWDIERVLEMNASILTLTGIALGTLVNKRFFLLSGIVSSFLLQHALQGWCPPVGPLRRMGFRTPEEIEDEKNELKQLR